MSESTRREFMDGATPFTRQAIRHENGDPPECVISGAASHQPAIDVGAKAPEQPFSPGVQMRITVGPLDPIADPSLEAKSVNVRDLAGATLDALVALGFGIPAEEIFVKGGVHCYVYLPSEQRGHNMGILTDALIPGEHRIYKPTEWWAHAGPVIDMDDISIEQSGDPGNNDYRKYAYVPDKELDGQHGDTALLAVARCFVAHHFGSEIPEQWIEKFRSEPASLI